MIPCDPFHKISRIIYFTEDARQHFKSRNATWFLGHHKEIIGVSGEWNFHASGHGKSPCDGVGASLKTAIRSHFLKGRTRPTTPQS